MYTTVDYVFVISVALFDLVFILMQNSKQNCVESATESFPPLVFLTIKVVGDQIYFVKPKPIRKPKMWLATRFCFCLQLETGVKYVLGYGGTILNIVLAILFISVLADEEALTLYFDQYTVWISLIVTMLMLIFSIMIILAINKWVCTNISTILFSLIKFVFLYSEKAFPCYPLWYLTLFLWLPSLSQPVLK